MADIADETMRVRYNDPVGERERRRMIAAVMGESPRKRTRL
jgi:hypothetical protein